MKTLLFFLSTLIALPALALDVASLHPLITETIRDVGGERVKVIEIGRAGMNVHQFEPRTGDVRKMAKAKIVIASGKGLESYLKDLKDSLRKDQTIVEVGRTIPSQKVSKKDQIYACCPHHAVGGIDPHWWHNVRHMERAVRIIQKELTKADPAGKAIYAANAKAARARLVQLDRWVKGQVATIPKKKRHLITAHAAFGYFCKAYGFDATFVQGLSADGEISAAQLAKSIEQIRSEAIPTVFPESTANPKTLRQIAKHSGASVGKPLIADGSVKSYQKMIQSNVTNIVAGLRK